MAGRRTAVLGGDARELRIADRLTAAGHEVSTYGLPSSGQHSQLAAESPQAAVADCEWIVCPMPGIGAKDDIYAPHAGDRIILDRKLLEASKTPAGGLVVGAATPSIRETTDELGIAVSEMKSDRSLAIQLSTGVAEAMVALLVDNTDKILPHTRMLVLGFGVVGAPFVDLLVAWGCRPIVAARRREARMRAAQRGAQAVTFSRRGGEMRQTEIVVNTVPSTDSISEDHYELCSGQLIVDIASPPGGMDHDLMRSKGLNVIWARGLAGGRAPITAGDAQYEYVKRVIDNADK